MKNKKLLIVSIALIILLSMGGVLAYFTYNRVSEKHHQIVTGKVYLNFIDGEDTINLINAFPETNDEARMQIGNIVEFTIEGVNESTIKDIYYEIKLIYGDDLANRNRLKDRDLKFDLVETTDGVRKTLINGVSFEEINNMILYIDKINKNTTEKISRTYELRMWISDEILISDTSLNANYKTAEYANSYANVKVVVYGYDEWKPYSDIVKFNIMKRANNFWEENIIAERENIIEVNFINMDRDVIEENYEKATIKTDMSSYLTKPIKGWLEVSATDSTKYVFNIASNDIIYLPSNSSSMFSGFSSLETVDFTNVSTREVTNMNNMFSGCTNLTSLNINEWDTGNVTNMSSMFSHCTSLANLDISNWNTSKLQNVGYMFNYASGIQSIDLSKWDMSNVTNTRVMFQFATGLKDIKIPESLKVIGSYAFNHNSAYNQTSFKIPDALTEIGDSHMWYDFGTNNFVEFIASENNQAVTVRDGILYDKNVKTLISIPNGKTFPNQIYELPEGITDLKESSFNRNRNIDKVIIPNSLIIEPQYTVEDGSGRKTNTLSIGIYVYTSVKEYGVKGDNPNYIAQGGCIYSKDGKELVAVPMKYEGVLNIPEGTESIRQEALWSGYTLNHMTNTTEVIIPASLTNIEAGQINTINSIPNATITVNSANPVYTVSNGKLVKK